MAEIKVYGIPTCDTTKKALGWYKEKNIPVSFHDYRTSGIQRSKLIEWSRKAGWETLLNKKSTTWRSLSTEEQQTVVDEKTAVDAMVKHTTLIKRPVVEMNDKIIIGYNEKYFTKQ